MFVCTLVYFCTVFAVLMFSPSSLLISHCWQYLTHYFLPIVLHHLVGVGKVACICV